MRESQMNFILFPNDRFVLYDITTSQNKAKSKISMFCRT